MTVRPQRTYPCLECGGRVLRLAGGIIWRHETPGADHAPRIKP